MKKYAFIHIPKNAGFTLKKAMENHQDFQIFDHGVIFNNIPKELKQVIVCREPTERFTSAFFYVKQHYCKDSKYLNPEMLITGILNGEREANLFLRPQPHFHSVNGKKIPTDWVFHEQVAWFNRPYKIIPMENIDQGFRELGLDIGSEQVNKSKKQEFIYSNNSLQYLLRIYEKDYLLYNYLKDNRNEGNYNWSDRSRWEPSSRPAPW
jgi:hypothetical protein